MFLEPDEHIIIMEDTYLNPLNITDIIMLVDAGIKTVHINDSVCWNELISPNSPKFDWSILDRRIEKYLNTNLKLILPFFFTMPNWFPGNWYYHNDKVLHFTIPNFGDHDFCSAVDDFMNELLNHYADLKDRIQFTYAIPCGGEFPWDAFLVDNFPFFDEVMNKFVIDRQKLLSKQHNEIWLYFHTFLGAGGNWNNIKLPILYQALKDEFGSIPFYSIQFAHFAVGNSPTDFDSQSKTREYHDKYGIEFFVGSQYCDGLISNFDNAIQQKVRGFITCPNMSFTSHRHVEPWMVENIKETNRKFKENK